MNRLMICCIPLLWSLSVSAADKLVLDINADEDMLSLSHNIGQFIFKPTMNFSEDLAGDLSKRVRVDALKNHLVISALVRIDGEVAGIATEQEIVRHDPQTGELDVDSAWLFILNHPKASGFLAVKQKEGNRKIFDLIQEVMANPDRDYEDRDHYLLGTTSNPVIELAKGGVAHYEGGRFEEYNAVNQADFKKHGRFIARLRFIIYPPEAQ